MLDVPGSSAAVIGPHSDEAEAAVLGSIMCAPNVYEKVSGFLCAEHFASRAHGRIYAAIAHLVERGRSPDPITLKQFFETDQDLESIGGWDYLKRLARSESSIVNAADYGRMVFDMARQRTALAMLDAARQAILDRALDSPQKLAAAGEILAELASDGGTDTAFDITVASQLAGQDVPERPWLVRDWIPRRQVTLLTGDGGVGKSLLGLQLMVAASAGTPWLGLSVEPLRSFGVFAEDDDAELHARLVDVAAGAEVDLRELDGLAYRSAVVDPCELVEIDAVTGQLRPTAYWAWLQRTVTAHGARLVLLDAATNLYGGDEIKRRHVNAFLVLLRRLAIEIDGVVLLLAHPSAQGISTGSGLSGSTHWNNAVRSRLYFTRETGEDADPDVRVLSRLKANYAGAGDSLRVRWAQGAFAALDAPGSLDRQIASSKADRLFLALLGSTYAAGTWVCPNPTARNYAPTVFAKHPERDGLGKPAFEGAMHRLIKVGTVVVETYGRPSEPRHRLALG